MKVLILGATGMLGHKLVQQWRDRFDLRGTLRGKFAEYQRFDIFEKEKIFEQVKIEDLARVRQIIEKFDPAAVINAIGIIKQQPTAGNIVRTLQVNSIFPHQLAEITTETGARLITIGTDCVFNGQKGDYTEGDPPDATDLYGKSKNLGEVSEGNCLTLRTSIIGRELKTDYSLVEWFLKNAGGRVKGFVKAIYTGFPTVVLADILADVLTNQKQLRGVFHVSSEKINKFDLLGLINREFKTKVEIEPSEDLEIDRSLDSTKFRTETGFRPESWEKMIRDMAQDGPSYEKWRK